MAFLSYMTVTWVIEAQAVANAILREQTKVSADKALPEKDRFLRNTLTFREAPSVG
mgnify:CR=1 FL=1